MENDELAEAVLKRLQKEYPWLYPTPYSWFEVAAALALLAIIALFF